MEIFYLVKGIIKTLSKEKKIWLGKTALLMCLSSILEFFTLTLVMPFLYLISNPTLTNKNEFIITISNFLNLTNIKSIQIVLGLIFLLCAIFSSLIKILNYRNYIYFSQSVGTNLSSLAFSNLINQNYSYHINKNSSESIAAISTFTDYSVTFIGNILQISTAIFSIIGILTALLLINFKFSLLTIIFFSISYFLLIRYTKKRISLNSKIAASVINNQVKLIQETTDSIRDILIGRHQTYFNNLFLKNEKEKRFRTGESQFLGGSPKYGVEALGIILLISITLISLYSTNTATINNTFPLVGAIALGSQRLLPVLQLAYSSLSSLRQDTEAVKRLLKIVMLKSNRNITEDSIEYKEFNKSIIFKNVYYSYNQNSDFILKNFNFKIKKGESIAIIGETGSGKSTLINLLLGLIDPTKGEIYIDEHLSNNNKLSSRHTINVSHVPQSVYLTDSSIKENIAYGIPLKDIDMQLMKNCARLACIDGFINSLSDKYNHVIGEKGIKISGGQRQRLGIARALYKNSNILILDEATNALDQETENKVIDSIKSFKKDLTLIMVTHRLSTLESFDRSIEIKNGIINN